MTQMTHGSLGVKIGRRVREVATVAEASALWAQMRDRLELAGRGGVSRSPQVELIDIATGETVGHVSYNGRVWEGPSGSWTPSTRELK